MTIGKLGNVVAVLAVFACAVLVASAAAESKARIVRLSEVEGSVQMDRATGDGFEKAFLNMPVIEGAKLKTGDDGRAEVEFEDGSALRLMPKSEADFTHLALGGDGQKLSMVQLIAGTAYVDVRGKKGDEFTLNFRNESVKLMEPAHFRVNLRGDEVVLAVFKGRVNVSGPSGQVEVAEKHSATFALAGDHYEMAKSIEPERGDAWDKEQAEYHDRYAFTGNGVSSPYAYGWSDLNYYGSYMSCPGYGSFWQPFFMDASWNPFMDGGWVWYPGYGYMWVSAYPWGWMPYRYGSWNYVPACGGWGWMPGYWNTWYPVPPVVNPPRRMPIPQPPTRGRQIVMVGRGLSTTPPTPPIRRITIQPGSAGLGVPRGSVRHLDRYSHEVSKDARPVEVRTEPPARTAPVSTAAPARGGVYSGGSSEVHPSRPSGGGSPGMAPPRPASPPSTPPPRSTPPH